MSSGKAVEAVTAAPTGSSTTQRRHAGPTTGTETILTEVLADIVNVERVSVDSHFFDDLGADSLKMAHFCARVRKRAELPPVSMKDVYRHPTIRGLALALAPAPVLQGAPAPAQMQVPTHAQVPPPEPVVPRRTSTSQYLLCGTLQFLLFLGAAFLTAAIEVTGYEWVTAGTGLIDTYLRSVLFGAANFLGLCILPILAKWVLIGRWKPQQIRIWSLAYVRFWFVKSLVQKNPLVLLMVGSPLYALYLRALGAKVGPGVAIFSRNVPVCTDLLTLGADTVIRKDSFFTCYRAHDGLIQTGAVTLGKDVLVGEATVIDIETSLGAGAQLGHASSLNTGQAVPDGERWHGSPAQRTEVDYRAVEPIDSGTLRRGAYTVLQVLNVLLLYLPLAVGGVALLMAAVPQLAALSGSEPLAFTSWTFYRDALEASFVFFFGSLLVGLLFVVTVPRVLNLAIKPGKLYRLYGFHYGVHRAIEFTTNRKLFTHLFGDSSYIVHYLRCLGYGLSPVQQTGSNFGTEVKHETPFLSSVGTGTVVADGLSIVNADYSSTSFRVSRTSIGRRNFLGNNVVYPSQGRTGDDCLLGTKVLVPIDGEVREGVGLLGSPSFEIPRSVQRDSRFDHLKSGDELRRRLAAKTKYNTVTIGLSLLVRWIYLFGVTLLAWGAADLYPSFGASAVGLAYVLTVLFSVVYFVFVERAVAGFKALSPQFCSIYEPYFWWHERFWKLHAPEPLLTLVNGTPFKGAMWRLLGARIGRRLFDDGATMAERSLVTMGDDVTLNAGSTVQGHSQEDDTFKSDRITIGAGCTVGVGAWVHYGVTMGDGAMLAPDSFLMKGEEVPQHARWGGNPARPMRDDPFAETATTSSAPPLSPARNGVATGWGAKTRW
jgi:non-ribosomal peptide synthetase-like protein